jgi:lipopolysaccharide/colanic/teichoic acid biosynthesis glycosyltransferase
MATIEKDFSVDQEVIVSWFPVPQISETDIEKTIDGLTDISISLFTNKHSDPWKALAKNQINIRPFPYDAVQALPMDRAHEITAAKAYFPIRIRDEFLQKIIKRTFDIVGSSILLILLLPLIFMAAIAIVLDSGFPIFYKQERSTIKNGKSFPFYKFRSMINGADKMKESLFRYNESNGALFKLKNDPRMTKVGRIIRKYSIDELPQLLNVLKGDMSLVGPRPLPVSDFDKVEENQKYLINIKDREEVRPGMTGLWQISGRCNLGFKEMIILDLYYVKYHSFLFDLKILLSTIPVVIFGRGGC